MVCKPVILGDGQLGTEIRKQTGWDYISRKKNGFDASDRWMNFDKWFGENSGTDYEMIINCIGHTNTYSEERQRHWDINYDFVVRLTDFCFKRHLMLVHISTDYVYTYSKANASEEDVPVHCSNWYGYTKLLGDAYVQLRAGEYLLIRCSFKPSPFPYEKAITSQIGNFDTTQIIASKIIDLCKNGANGVYNVGTETKTIYDLAKKTRTDVQPTDMKIHDTMPTDITMNCNKAKEFMND